MQAGIEPNPGPKYVMHTSMHDLFSKTFPPLGNGTAVILDGVINVEKVVNLRDFAHRYQLVDRATIANSTVLYDVHSDDTYDQDVAFRGYNMNPITHFFMMFRFFRGSWRAAVIPKDLSQKLITYSISTPWAYNPGGVEDSYASGELDTPTLINNNYTGIRVPWFSNRPFCGSQFTDGSERTKLKLKCPDINSKLLFALDDDFQFAWFIGPLPMTIPPTAGKPTPGLGTSMVGEKLESDILRPLLKY
jgi:hypothetical protein